MLNLKNSIFLITALLPFLSSCGSDAQAQADPEVTFEAFDVEVLASWSFGDPLDAPDWDATKLRVITNSSDLAVFWSDYTVETTIPDIDFSETTVIMYDRGPDRWSPVLPNISAEYSSLFLTTRVELLYEICSNDVDSVPVHNTHERPVMILALPISESLFVGETVSFEDC